MKRPGPSDEVCRAALLRGPLHRLPRTRGGCFTGEGRRFSPATVSRLVAAGLAVREGEFVKVVHA